MKKIVLIGNGKLADSIENNLPLYSSIPIEKYSQIGDYDEDTVFVHIGSGREYLETLTKANESRSSYIQAATEKDFKLSPPFDLSMRYVNAPNLDINIIKLIYLLKLGKELFRNEPKTIVESHQKDKQSSPGTALKFAEYLNIDDKDILSIRDEARQKELNIKNLGHHAYHKIEIGDDNSNITIETKIEGAVSYAKGLSEIVQCLSNLEVGKYEIEDLIELKLL